jgi:hypothetical protein
MLYSKLAEVYESLGNTTKRLEKTDILSKFLEYLSEKEFWRDNPLITNLISGTSTFMVSGFFSLLSFLRK